MAELLAIRNSSIVQRASALPVPVIIQEAGQQAAKRFIEFFTAEIRNRNTRQAYARAVAQFMAWCEDAGLALPGIEPVHVAAYVEGLQAEASAATVKQQLAAIRALFDYLVVGQVVPFNPAAPVRGPRHVVAVGKTPVMDAEQARKLLDAIELDTIIGLRDRAMIALMLYSFARVSAVIQMKVEDYFPGSKRWKIRLLEKGGKYRELPMHHKAEAYLDHYLDSAGIRPEKKSPLFRSIRHNKLTGRAIGRDSVYRMIRRRAAQAGLPEEIAFGCHSLRGTGITLYRKEGGALEIAQAIAGHADARTTKLYDRHRLQVELEEIERIRI